MQREAQNTKTKASNVERIKTSGTKATTNKKHSPILNHINISPHNEGLFTSGSNTQSNISSSQQKSIKHSKQKGKKEGRKEGREGGREERRDGGKEQSKET